MNIFVQELRRMGESETDFLLPVMMTQNERTTFDQSSSWFDREPEHVCVLFTARVSGLFSFSFCPDRLNSNKNAIIIFASGNLLKTTCHNNGKEYSACANGEPLNSTFRSNQLAAFDYIRRENHFSKSRQGFLKMT